MATKIISFKILVLLFSNFIYIPSVQLINGITGIEAQPNSIVFYIFVGALFLPEFGVLISSNFRVWLKEALEHNDGVMDNNDLKEMISHLGAYYCAKMFTLLMLCDMFYEINVKDIYVYLCFSGFIGNTALLILLKFIKKE